MPKLEIMGFDGLVPRQSPTMLGDAQAQVAENVKLYAGELRYWRGSLPVYAITTPPRRSINLSANPFFPSAGSSLLAVYDVGHVASVGERVTFSGSAAVGGIPAAAINTTLLVTSIYDANSYYVQTGVLATSGTGGIGEGGAAVHANYGYIEGDEPQTLTLYRMHNLNGDSRWLSWTKDVDVAQSPLADTSEYRIYYTGDGAPKQTNWAMASPGPGPYPTAYYDMGVPSPTAAPVLSLGAGASVGTEMRAYVYTFVSTFGTVKEESGPSPPAVISVPPANLVNVGGMQTSAPGSHNITHKRIYRSVTGATTSDFEFVAEVPIATVSYADNLLVAQLGEVLITIGWGVPPAGLQGIVNLPCGALAGFVGNTVYFSEPFFVHSWPIAYALSVPHLIIGLGVYGNSLVVMTGRYPFVINGPYPGAMSIDRVQILEPCSSKRSIVADGTGVLYASPNGVVAIGADVRGVISEPLFRRDEWQARKPDLLNAESYDGKYVATYEPSETLPTMVLSRGDTPAMSTLTEKGYAIYVDSLDAKLYLVRDNVIYEVDGDPINPLKYMWRSKRFMLPQAISWAAMRLDADYGQVQKDAEYDALIEQIKAENAALLASGMTGDINTQEIAEFEINGDELLIVPPVSGVRSAQVHIYGDGVLQAVMTMTGRDPVRLPSFKCVEYEIQIVGTIDVRSVSVATSVLELRTS